MPSSHQIMLSHGDRCEATAIPFWGITTRGGASGGMVLHAGIWFNRPDAEEHLRLHSYRYPKSARVWCFSGHESAHLREMYANARAEKMCGTQQSEEEGQG